MSKVYQTGRTVTDVLSDILDTQSAVPPIANRRHRRFIKWGQNGFARF